MNNQLLGTRSRRLGLELVASIRFPALAADRFIIGTVYVDDLSDKPTSAFQNENGWQSTANVPFKTRSRTNHAAQWCGITWRLFWTFSDTPFRGLRLE